MDLKLFVGIDISKEKFDACVLLPGKQPVSIAVNNTEKDAAQFIQKLFKEHQLSNNEIIFCIEHTGKYMNLLIKALQKKKCLIWIESARQIKNSFGLQRGKNDQVDAKRIADYAFRFKDKVKEFKPRNADLEQLKAKSSAGDFAFVRYFHFLQVGVPPT